MENFVVKEINKNETSHFPSLYIIILLKRITVTVKCTFKTKLTKMVVWKKY